MFENALVSREQANQEATEAVLTLQLKGCICTTRLMIGAAFSAMMRPSLFLLLSSHLSDVERAAQVRTLERGPEADLERRPREVGRGRKKKHADTDTDTHHKVRASTSTWVRRRGGGVFSPERGKSQQLRAVVIAELKLTFRHGK